MKKLLPAVLAALLILSGCSSSTGRSLGGSSSANTGGPVSSEAASSVSPTASAHTASFTPCEDRKVPLCLLLSQELALATLENDQITVTKKTGQFAYETIPHDGWIYYNSPDSHDKIYRMKYDGSVNQLLTSNGGYNLNICDERLYFRNYQSGKLGSLALDGKDQREIGSDKVWQACEIEGWIYYTKDSDNGGSALYMIKPDGSGRTEICDKSPVDKLTVQNGKIYFLSGTGLYQLEPNGQAPNLLCDAGEFFFAGGSIICTGAAQTSDGIESRDLYGFNLKTGGRLKIAEGVFNSLIVYDDSIFCKADAGALYAMSLDGKAKVHVSAEPFDSMVILS